MWAGKPMVKVLAAGHGPGRRRFARADRCGHRPMRFSIAIAIAKFTAKARSTGLTRYRYRDRDRDRICPRVRPARINPCLPPAQPLRVVGAAVFDHRPEDACDFVGGGGYRRLGAELGLQAAEPIAQPRLRTVQRLRRHAQGVGQTVLDFSRVGGVGSPAGDPVVGAQPHPRGEVFRTGKLFNVGADFAQKCQTGLDAHAFDGGQVDAELLAKLFAHRLLDLRERPCGWRSADRSRP
jgi:hypothetical protein